MTDKPKNFLFVDMQSPGMVDAKEIDGMAPGVFTDMWGYEFEIKAEELPIYVQYTKAALESTRDSAGEIVGFPIDAMNHDHAEAAGWITDVNLANSGNITIVPRWTDLGRELIAADQMRYFSPTIDLNAKVIMGGSLTNWPASRTREHQILLKPVELSGQLQALDIPNESVIEKGIAFLSKLFTGFAIQHPATEPIPVESAEGADDQHQEVSTMVELSQLTPEQKQELAQQAIAELSGANPPAELASLIEAKAAEIAAVKLAEQQRVSHIAEFAAKMVGGDGKPVGLPINRDELVTFLSSLNNEQREAAEGMLTRIADAGLIDFSEHGHSQILQGTTILPEPIKNSLRQWLQAGKSLEEFFKVNAVELGAMADYNLTEFVKKE